MDVFLNAVESVLQPWNMVTLVASVVIGIVVGAIPGLTVTMALALAVPLTIWMEPVPAIVLLLGLYASGVYGGSISACLLNAPGTPASAACSQDSYELAKKGQAMRALSMALWASAYGGLFSVILLVLIAPQLAAIAFRFGPTEIAALLVLALVLIAMLSGPGIIKGLLSAAIGMTLAVIGADPMLSIPRFTFDSYELYDGLAYIPLLIGLFAIGEMLTQAEDGFARSGGPLRLVTTHRRAATISPAQWRRCALPMVMAGAIGSFIGILPGIGASVAAFLGYSEARRISKRPQKFGKGSLEGIAAAESANSAVTGSAMIPTLALAIPGDPPTAILLGALMIQGVTAGPLIFLNSPEIVYSIYLVLFLTVILTLVVGWLILRPVCRVLEIPKVYLYPVILTLCVAGSYSVRNSILDIFVMLGAGILGYLLRLFAIPIAPLLIAFILTAPLEEALSQTLAKSNGDLLIFVQRPISVIFLGFALFLIVLTIWRGVRSRPQME